MDKNREKVSECKCRGSASAWSGGLMTVMVLLSGLLGSVQPMVAQTELADQLCLQQKTGLNNPSCTANDVRIGRLEIAGAPITCMVGEEVTATLRATIESGPDRYDIGIWLNQEGESAKTGLGNSCFRTFLPSPLSSTICQPDGPTYYTNPSELANDVCGDVHASNTNPCGNAVTGACSDGSGGTCLFTTREFTATFTCADTDGDLKADIDTCTSWDQQANNKAEDSCTGVLGTDPGTGAKCNCGPIPVADLEFDLCEGVVCDGPGTDGLCDGGEVCNPANGQCEEVANAPSGTLCRPSAGVCDPAEVCDGVSDACPADALYGSEVTCGTSAGVCDLPEVCSGTSASCPADGPNLTTQCRASMGVCDLAEFCSDASDNCPADGPNLTTECRASGGVCDLAEFCSDASDNCPADGPNLTTECRASGGVCDLAEFCSDASDNCPADGPNLTTECRASGGVCDLAEFCSDASDNCPADGPNLTTECRASAGVCDLAEFCSDASDNCPADGPNLTTECRASAGVCDLAEFCSDASDNCPADGDNLTTQCRPAEGDCDVAEFCSNANDNCPADGMAGDGTSCGSPTDTSCDNPDTCLNGVCVPNNEPAGTVCNAGDPDTCDPAELCPGGGVDCPADDPGVGCPDASCRTVGYWETHAGNEKTSSINSTLLSIGAAGGSIEVCGETLTNTLVESASSALEGLCNSGGGKNQLLRQLIAMSLNCVNSDSPGPADCTGVAPFDAVFAACNDVCADESALDSAVSDCVAAVDCLNNGGQLSMGSGGEFLCQTGTCMDNGADCNPLNKSNCAEPALTTCVPFPQTCHDNPLLNPDSPAGSAKLCNDARKSDCTVLTGNCDFP